jgi:deoxyribose-phosphate aldolase
MDYQKILSTVDHTALKQNAKWEDIRVLCDEAMEYGTASVCIPQCYLAQARDYTQGKLTLCTVIGFPNGNSTTATKVFETEDAIRNGATEIDMVINIGWLKDKRYEEILGEIRSIKEACHGKLLKVIIETCLLTDEEKKVMCRIVSDSGADYIKTSTGFSTGGATAEDIKLMAENVAKHLKIKAAGGIRTLADAELFLNLGADRLGSSSVVRLVKEATKK